MPKPMSYEEAADYAAQWGETASAGGRAAYNLGAPCRLNREEAAELRTYALADCKPIAERGDCCGTAGACQADLADIARLVAFLDSYIARLDRLESGNGR